MDTNEDSDQLTFGSIKEEVADVPITNPWAVESLEEYLHYCCPECDVKSESKDLFVSHAWFTHKEVIVNVILSLEMDICLFCFFRQGHFFRDCQCLFHSKLSLFALKSKIRSMTATMKLDQIIKTFVNKACSKTNLALKMLTFLLQRGKGGKDQRTTSSKAMSLTLTWALIML